MMNNRVFAKVAVVTICVLFAAGNVRADVKVDRMFSDHMVLQRDMPAPVWGTASPGEEITVAFAGQEKKTKADKDGKWMVKLDPLKVGEPGKMTISGKNSVTLEDVLVGEVWVGSGQSNMAGGAGGYARRDEVLAAMVKIGPYPKLRLYRGTWQESSPQNIAGFSAIHFSFGQPLQKELDVPVGLIVGAVGGTPSGRWLTGEMFEADEACQKMLKDILAKNPPEKAKMKYKEDLAKWEKAAKLAKEQGKKAPRKPRAPVIPGDVSGLGDLYRAKIEPAVPYAIRGVLWDQGESGTRIAGIDQYTTMGGLIRGWRKVWGQGDFPFLYIQKPSGGGCAWDKDNPVTRMANDFTPLPSAAKDDGSYREVHIRIMDYPNTAMVSASDLGSGVHPVNKSGYGARAARVALGLVYKKEVEIYGPIYDSHKVEGSKVRVKFKHIGKGLAFRGGDKLQGFAIAGDDKVFQWADATIDGDTVVLSSEKVSKPTAVRYGWSRNHTWANLFNKDELPALTFRTDGW